MVSLMVCFCALPASGSYCYKSTLIEEEGDETEHAQSPIVACSHGMPIYRGSAVSPRESDDYDQEYFVRSDGEFVKYLATPEPFLLKREHRWVASGEALNYRQDSKTVRSGRGLASISPPADLPLAASKEANAVYKKAYASFARSKRLGKLKVERLNGAWTQKITTADGTVVFKNAKGFIATLNEFNQWVVVNPKGELHQILGASAP